MLRKTWWYFRFPIFLAYITGSNILLVISVVLWKYYNTYGKFSPCFLYILSACNVSNCAYQWYLLTRSCAVKLNCVNIHDLNDMPVSCHADQSIAGSGALPSCVIICSRILISFFPSSLSVTKSNHRVYYWAAFLLDHLTEQVSYWLQIPIIPICVLRFGSCN